MLSLDIPINGIDAVSDYQHNALNVFDAGLLESSDLAPGKLSTKAGHAAFQYVVDAALAALRGDIAAVVTLPMNKEATQASHPEFTGHTELLARLCEVHDVVLMLATDEVVVTHVSTHVSLTEAIQRVTSDRITRVIQLTSEALRRFTADPRLAVCGLNPHAGESGLFGDEELRTIEPTIAMSAAQGINVSGPFPADTIFRQAIELDRFDAIICMYHDQGHAPMKLFAFDRAVNVTLGLPIIRTSVDHGTAFDIAWQGVASTRSLLCAIRYAQKLLQTENSNSREGTPI